MNPSTESVFGELSTGVNSGAETGAGYDAYYFGWTFGFEPVKLAVSSDNYSSLHGTNYGQLISYPGGARAFVGSWAATYSGYVDVSPGTIYTIVVGSGKNTNFTYGTSKGDGYVLIGYGGDT